MGHGEPGSDPEQGEHLLETEPAGGGGGGGAGGSAREACLRSRDRRRACHVAAAVLAVAAVSTLAATALVSRGWRRGRHEFVQAPGEDGMATKFDLPTSAVGVGQREDDQFAEAPSKAMATRFDLSDSAPVNQEKEDHSADDHCTTLYGFALIIPGSYEEGLFAWQYQYQVNIFACDEFVVYSNKSIQVTPGLTTHVVDVDLTAKFGGEFGTALNTDIFMAVWKKVISEGRYSLYCWTVKADADTVFFATRLKHTLLKYTEDEETGVYLNNCKMGLHGPLEVFSRKAVDAWYKGARSCFMHFYKLCSGPCLWGEDMFIDQCMGRHLKIKRESAYNLLTEAHCDPPEGWRDCGDENVVAFHPFKQLPAYKRCMYNAEPKLYPAEVLFKGDELETLLAETTTPEPEREPAGSDDDDDDHDDSSEKEKEESCDMEDDVDYETDGSLYAMQGIVSAKLCKEKCRGEVKCGAWTWGKARDKWGLTNVCFLKTLSSGKNLKRHKNRDVISGLPCRPGERHRGEEDEEDEEDEESKAVVKHKEHDPQDEGFTVPATLYCFCLMIAGSYEEKLLAWQYQYGANIFGCDEAAVYSNRSVEVTPGLSTSVVDVDLTCQYGGEFGTALNTDIFRAIWNQVVKDGRFQLYSWTAKADADTVFFASRMVPVLRHYKETKVGVYLNNCKMGLHGPLEVFSKNAVKTWYHGADECYLHFYHLCKGPCLWGEDMFIDQCLGRKLKADRENYYHLLTEDHCDPPKGWRDCKDKKSVAFHPFKKLDEYQRCLHHAEPGMFASAYAKK